MVRALDTVNTRTGWNSRPIQAELCAFSMRCQDGGLELAQALIGGLISERS